MMKADMLYEGKAKKIYAVEGQPDFVWVEFKDDLTAGNGAKSGSFAGKGEVNHSITSLVFKYLKDQGITTHWQQDTGPRTMVCHRVEIVPLEVVVRNKLAGSTARRLGFAEGTELDAPLMEFYYKKDQLNDPFVNDDQALLLQAVRQRDDLDQLRYKAQEINVVLKNFFKEAGIELVDFKLEFGWDSAKQLVLADEITPDSCRLWDIKTGKRLDKDRFRRDWGEVKESYEFILSRLKETWEKRV